MGVKPRILGVANQPMGLWTGCDESRRSFEVSKNINFGLEYYPYNDPTLGMAM
jgi:hypothetical protein